MKTTVVPITSIFVIGLMVIARGSPTAPNAGSTRTSENAPPLENYYPATETSGGTCV